MNKFLDRMFRRIDLGRVRGADMSAHMPMLYSLARICSPKSAVVECGTSGGFSTHALLCGVIEGGGHLHSYDVDPACAALAMANMGITTNDPEFARWSFTVKDAAEAAGGHADGSVGLFFLDTSHFFEPTRKELEAWLPKIHPDGLMCGHDYYLHLTPGWESSGVKQAVDEFAAAHQDRFRLQVTPDDQGLFVLWPK